MHLFATLIYLPTAGLDYSTVLTPSILTFGAGSIIGNTACFDVSLLTDSVVEGQEFFFLSLTSSDGLVTISSGQSSATVNIVDISSEFVIVLVSLSFVFFGFLHPVQTVIFM